MCIVYWHQVLKSCDTRGEYRLIYWRQMCAVKMTIQYLAFTLTIALTKESSGTLRNINKSTKLGPI